MLPIGDRHIICGVEGRNYCLSSVSPRNLVDLRATDHTDFTDGKGLNSNWGCSQSPQAWHAWPAGGTRAGQGVVCRRIVDHALAPGFEPYSTDWYSLILQPLADLPA